MVNGGGWEVQVERERERERERKMWVGGWVESVKECGCVGLWVQLWGVESMGFGFEGSGED